MTEAPAIAALPFAESSAIRRIAGESVVLAGGGRALLMQIAHPAVARGVAEHSSYRRQRLQRLLRTLRPTYAVAFGTREQALEAASGVNRLHAGVVGEGYAAGDTDLLLWVLATLIDTTLVTYERFVGEPPEAEASEYYEQMKVLGELFGLPRGYVPPDLTAFAEYVDEMVERLEVTDEAREIARELFRPTLGPWLALWPLRHLTAGLLPPRLRDAYAMTWGSKREGALEAVSRVSRAVVPRLPHALRRPPGFLMPPH